MARIAVKVHPRARCTALSGRYGDTWKLDLAAPPAEGKANQECLRWIAERAGVPRSRVRIVTGATSRQKIIDVEGMTQEELERRLKLDASTR